MTIVDQAPARPAEQDEEVGLLLHAAELVVTAQLASVSMLQRKQRTSWADTQLRLDRLQELGVVGAKVGDADRPVLVAPDGLTDLLGRLRDDLTALVTPPPAPTSPPPPPPMSETPPPPRADLVKRPHHPLAPTPPADLAHHSGPRRQEGERVLLVATRRHATHLVTTLRQPSTHLAIARAGVKHTWLVGQGVASWGRRFAGAATHGHYKEQLRISRATGDRVGVREWGNDLREAKNDRLERLAMLPRAALGVLVAGAAGAGLLLLVLLLVGVVAFFSQGGAGWASWWGGVGATIAFTVWLAGAAWSLAVWFGAPAVVVAAWREGKRAGDPPMWMLAPDERKLATSEITPSKVVVAIRDLGITELRKAVQAAPDAGAGLLGPIAVIGEGVEGDIFLPSGVSTDQFMARCRRFAENLGRHEHEVHLSIPAARTIRYWAADSGALDKPIGPSPLVTTPSMKANAKTGRAPIGDNLRGQPVGLATHQRHATITGVSNHGKTAILRGIALWEAFDVHPEFRIGDLKGYGDWDMFGPIEGRPGLATCYISGPADDHVIAVTEMLEEGVREMNRRLQAEPKDWPPLILVVDEAQKAYMCPVKDDQGRPYGGKSATSRFFKAAREIHNQGRAVNVVLWQGTQDPTDENFPKIVREGAHIRMSLVVGTESQSKMALGDAAVNGGAAPHLLRQDIDKGVIVMHGGVELPRGETSITVRTHFIDTDTAWQVARRAIERRRKAGVVAHQVASSVEKVDHLADIQAAMRGEKRPRTVVVLGRLIEDNPAVYEPWGHDDLANAVREYGHLGLGIRKYAGDSVLRLEEVQAAMGMRE